MSSPAEDPWDPRRLRMLLWRSESTVVLGRHSRLIWWGFFFFLQILEDRWFVGWTLKWVGWLVGWIGSCVVGYLISWSLFFFLFCLYHIFGCQLKQFSCIVGWMVSSGLIHRRVNYLNIFLFYFIAFTFMSWTFLLRTVRRSLCPLHWLTVNRCLVSCPVTIARVHVLLSVCTCMFGHRKWRIHTRICWPSDMS